MSEFKTDKIIPVDAGSTTTIGCTGDTIATGAGTTLNIQGTYSGINSISWDTTAKTANFTAETNKGYFINTTSGSVTITLPATPVAGNFIGIKDYALTAQTNPIIINANGNKIQGSTANFQIVTQGGAANLVYVDSTQGWLTYDAGQASDITESAAFIVATGGTITTCGDYKIHTFTGPGTFCVSAVGNPIGSVSVDYLVVAGGGAGQGDEGGGGGAGGYRTSYPSPAGVIPVSVTGYPITIGGGGSGPPGSATPCAANGSNSVFSTITSAGGGGGTQSGGSGGGGRFTTPGGSGNTPPVSPPQGNNGGNGAPYCNGAGGGGGGGAVAAGNSGGTSGGYPARSGGPGGNGLANSINGSSVTRAGGGGGGIASYFAPPVGTSGDVGTGGSGGGGNGGTFGNPGNAGTANTGGGGGAGSGGGGPAPAAGVGGNGGSGIVIIRYKYQ